MSIPPNANYLESIRLFELRLILEYLKDIAPERARILEVGAGTGWQARELATHGYQVSAIDIPTSNHSHARVWEVIDFDGVVLTKMDGAYILKDLGDETEVTYELSVGVSMPIPQMMITKQEKTTIDQALAQLKEHCEG